MDNNEVPFSIFLDLSKVFDTLNHNTLLCKLDHYGIEGVPLKLYESYLLNRTQYIEIADVKSETLSIATGVPQGSIIRPILFIISINDFLQASKIFNFISYADDTTLLSTMSNFTNAHNDDTDALINQELYKINEWLEINNLSLNGTKFKIMVFHMPEKTLKTPVPKINNIIIKRLAILISWD